MDVLLRPWTRYQWFGDLAAAVRLSEPDGAETETVGWNLCQWVGDRPGHPETRPWLPDPVVDTSGGLSGFGHSDSGGQRWAVSRREPAAVPATVEPVDHQARAAA